jgi:basic amino acid/polyamine antiporter, APA family
VSGAQASGRPDARDRGLVRTVGRWGFAASIVNGVVGAGIFSLPAAMAGLAGAWAPLALLCCALAIGAVSICAAEASARVATSGGAYGYADAAFGPVAAFVTGILVWLSSVLACGGIAAALVDGLASAWPVLDLPVLRSGVIALVIGVMAMLNIAGVAPAARLLGLLTLVKLAPLLLLVLVGGTALLAGSVAAAGPLPPAPPGGFGPAILLALFAFSGMETPLAASGEVDRPARTIPQALLAANLFVAILYILIQLVTQGLLGPNLAGSATPLADAMARISPALGLFMLAAASFSRFVWIGTDMLGAPRLLFAFARDGMLPAGLAAVHPRTHAPHVAILVHGVIALLLAATGTFETLAMLAGLASAGIFIMICASAWRLHRQGRAHGETPERFAMLPPAAFAGIAAMIAIIALAAPRDMAGLALTVAASALWAWFRRRAAAHR